MTNLKTIIYKGRDHFFRYKGYKNGNMHFEFISENVWAAFNQRISKLKGYPLFEAKKQTAYQDRQTGRQQQEKAPMAAPTKKTEPMKAKILFEVKMAS